MKEINILNKTDLIKEESEKLNEKFDSNIVIDILESYLFDSIFLKLFEQRVFIF